MLQARTYSFEGEGKHCGRQGACDRIRFDHHENRLQQSIDQVNIGAAGLRCLLDPSACPRLRTLTLVRTGRVNDHCLKVCSMRRQRVAAVVRGMVEFLLAVSRHFVCAGLLIRPRLHACAWSFVLPLSFVMQIVFREDCL